MPLIGSVGPGSTEKDFSSFIEKAVQAKSKPIEVLEKSQELYQKKSTLLREIKADLVRIQDLSKYLYSFNTPIGSLVCRSSDTNSIEATAEKSAQTGSYTIQVLSLAKGQKISTSEISFSKNIPAGEFSLSVGEEKFSYHFLGGNLEDLVACINTLREKNPLFSEIVRVKSEDWVMVITSTKSGEKNSILLEEDPKGVLQSIGLFSGNKEKIFPLFPKDTDLFQIETRDSEKRIQLLSSVPIDPKLFLRITFSDIVEKEIPFRWIILGDGSISEKLMKVELSESTLVEENFTQKKQILVSLADFFSEVVSVETVYVRLEKGLLHEVSLVMPGDSKWNQPKKVIIPCTDAKILYSDIPIQREQNKMDDVIPSVSLFVKSVSSNPVILDVEANKDTALEAFVEFLYAYNQLVEKINLVTSTIPLEQAESEWNLKEEQKDKYAVLQGEGFLREILYEFYKIFSKKHTVVSTRKINLVAQIGVKLLFNMESLRGLDNGKVEFDPKVYTEIYGANPTEVRSFFGVDSTGDKVIDSGFAYEVSKFLSKYVSRNGLLDTKAESYDTLRKITGEKVQQKKESVEEFRKKQERDFSKLEGIQKGMKDMQRLLDSLSPKN